MTKVDLKAHAVALREQGYSYNLILQQVPVSRSTLSLWLAEIPYRPNALVMNRVRGAILQVAEWQNAQKRRSIEQAGAAAVAQLGHITPRDLLMLGIGVYMGEGTKSYDSVRVINSDPQVICLAIR